MHLGAPGRACRDSDAFSVRRGEWSNVQLPDLRQVDICQRTYERFGFADGVNAIEAMESAAADR